MRHFIYFSNKAKTSGNFRTDDLMKAGRMDIVCNVIISAISLSHKIRDDVHLHLIFNGAPNPPMHLELISNEEIPLSKKDVAGLIKRLLYKCNSKKKTKVFPGGFIEKKSLQQLLKELQNEGLTIQILDPKGNSIRSLKNSELKNSVFLIGDHEGLPKKELKRYKNKLSIGKETYFASQTITIIHNEIDIRDTT